MSPREVALGHEFIIGDDGGRARDAERRRERPRRGEAGAGLEPTVQHRQSELLGQLSMERRRKPTVEGDERFDRLTPKDRKVV